MDERDRAFKDFETTIMAGGNAIPVRVTAEALHGISGYGVGPQTPAAIFGENRPLLTKL